MYRQLEKKLVKQQYVLQMSAQYGELRPTTGWDLLASLRHPANFNGFHVLAALLHGNQVVGVSETLRRWTDGATYVRQGDHHVGHWSITFIFVYIYKLFVVAGYCSFCNFCDGRDWKLSVLFYSAVISLVLTAWCWCSVLAVQCILWQFVCSTCQLYARCITGVGHFSDKVANSNLCCCGMLCPN